ncbi:hypothetical protein LZL87_013846 [Fusarium oxysporum]|nr:hypothetical protein LZL87_013846 [Fusarium oxysporum]
MPNPSSAILFVNCEHFLPIARTRATSWVQAVSRVSIEEFETDPNLYLRFRLQIEERLAYRLRGLYANSNAPEEFTQNAKHHMANKARDWQTLEALFPIKYKAVCCRFTPVDKYMEALNKSDAELISTPIKQVEGNSIIATDGERRPYGMILCGTGFEAHEQKFPLKARETAILLDLWSMDGGDEG